MSEAAETARTALSRGDLIGAHDATVSAIAAGDESHDVRHLQILALARMGDTDRASELFAAYGLDLSEDAHHRAAGARLLKDRALALPEGDARRVALEAALEAYHRIYVESGDYFPGVNAATLALLAGQLERARSIAEALLSDAKVDAAADYYAAVTRAEAMLLLGRPNEVIAALRTPPVQTSRDFGARSTTWRQLAMVANHLGLAEEVRDGLLVPLSPPRAAHYCGHMFAVDPVAEVRLRGEIDAALTAEDIGFAYGALACGADILFAEAVLARGAELHIVLPFAEEDFLAQSVLPGGEGWEARYRLCLAGAASVTFASEMEFFGDPAQYGYASRMAMGLARLRAQHLVSEAVQIVVWDGKGADGAAGTGVDAAAWSAQDGRLIVIEPGTLDRALVRPEPRFSSAYERTLAAILFTDFAGFSTLKETALPAFWDGVMRRVAEVLDMFEGDIACRNSWGDALYAVASGAPVAAEIALRLQDALEAFDYATLGLDGKGGMRIGAHYGPAYRTIDHITGRTTFYGTEVSKAARIEPVTPPGAVFVTEPFAAVLALEAGDRFACRYVGRIPLAKKYGDYPMYRLTRV